MWSEVRRCVSWILGPPTGHTPGCNGCTLCVAELSAVQLRQGIEPACLPAEVPVRRVLALALALTTCALPLAAQAPAGKAAPQPTDLDTFMARALQRRDTDRKNLSDYVLDEVEEVEVPGPGRAPLAPGRRGGTATGRRATHRRAPPPDD